MADTRRDSTTTPANTGTGPVAPLTGGAAPAGDDKPPTPDGMTPEERSAAALAAEGGLKDKAKDDEKREAEAARGEDLIVVRDGFSYNGDPKPIGSVLRPEWEWVRRGVMPYMNEANPIAKPRSVVEQEARLKKTRDEAAAKTAGMVTKSNPG